MTKATTPDLSDILGDEEETVVEAPLLISPITGAVVDEENIDSIISAYKDLQDHMDEIMQFKNVLRDLAFGLTEDNGNKTRRLRGSKYEVELPAPELKPNSAMIKQCLMAFPEAAKKCIVPTGYRVAAREWGKMAKTTSQDKEYNAVKDLIAAAYDAGHENSPSVKKVLEIQLSGE